MTKDYSRQNKSSAPNKNRARQHLSNGLSALQKTIAIIGGSLGIITASLTINNYLNNDKNKDTTPQSTTIIKQIETPSQQTPATVKENAKDTGVEQINETTAHSKLEEMPTEKDKNEEENSTESADDKTIPTEENQESKPETATNP